jgi:aquaporin Z
MSETPPPTGSLPPDLKRRIEFANPRLESRRLFAEFFGTFFLVVVAAGAGVVDAVTPGEVGRVAAVVAPGLMVMAIILFMGAVSGAHLNPAVSIGFAARGDFPWRRVPGYIAAQLLGAIVACAFLWLMFGKVGMLGATEPGPGISDSQAVVMELVLTLGLVSTILGTASKAQNVGPLAALAVGGYIALAGLWGSPISGASMNPARSFGPDLLLMNFAHYWVYLVGPVAGALLAVGAAYLLRGPGGDEPAIQAAQGRLEIFPNAPSAWNAERHQDMPHLMVSDDTVIWRRKGAITRGFLRADWGTGRPLSSTDSDFEGTKAHPSFGEPGVRS